MKKKCPKCNQDNNTKALFCWACYYSFEPNKTRKSNFFKKKYHPSLQSKAMQKKISLFQIIFQILLSASIITLFWFPYAWVIRKLFEENHIQLSLLMKIAPYIIIWLFFMLACNAYETDKNKIESIEARDVLIDGVVDTYRWGFGFMLLGWFIKIIAPMLLFIPNIVYKTFKNLYRHNKKM